MLVQDGPTVDPKVKQSYFRTLTALYETEERDAGAITNVISEAIRCGVSISEITAHLDFIDQ